MEENFLNCSGKTIGDINWEVFCTKKKPTQENKTKDKCEYRYGTFSVSVNDLVNSLCSNSSI